ncbi:signal transduction histidine kinase [Dyadobacter jiangsuensis]|uniref:histidine kinase n=2 Tax=Dyadobacter jiangsuensis TaxID=1591085 RepID=A0A2P8FWG5_9BACT|nr:signal transduction histidine kinase [Dyadobacter jiangsuensis]
MPQNSVRSLAADAEGFVWIATENGLARFDGQRFNVFDKSFVGTTSNRFYMLSPSMNATGAGRPGQQKPGQEIYAAADYNQFVKIEHGIAKVDSLYYQNKIRTLSHFNNGNPHTLISVGIPTYLRDVARPSYYIIPDSYGEGKYYVIDSASVQLYHGERKLYQTAFATDTLPLWWNYFMLGDKLYYAGEGSKVLGINAQGARPVSIDGDMLRDNQYNGEFEGMKVFWNITSDQLFFYHRKKLYAVTETRKRGLTTRLVLDGYDLDEQVIQSVYRDPATETLFLGSPSKGLFVLTKQPFEALTSPEPDIANVYYATVPIRGMSILTAMGMVLGKDPVTGQTTTRKVPVLEGLYTGDKRSLFYDKQGLLWIKMGDFLYRVDVEANRVLYKLNFHTEIKHIYPDQNGKVWIATGTKGIYTLDPSEKDPQPKLVKEAIKGTYLQTLGDDMLVATTTGLYIFNRHSGGARLIKSTDGIYIKSLYVDNANRVWMTANGEGLLMYENNKLTRFPLDRNRYLGSPHCIVNDGHGFFWIPTDKGLFQIAVKDLLDYVRVPFDLFYLYHAKEEGFLTNEFNGGCQPCASTLSDGTISLPSLNGLIWFQPDKVITKVPSAGIVLDRILVNRQWLTGLGDTLVLPANPVQARFFFSTPYYGDAYNLNLSYALLDEGEPVQASDWIPIQSNDFSIVFSNLGHGRHTLLVRKVNGFGKDNHTIREICVIVPPLWYQTWWAKILFALAVAGGFYLYNSFRLRKISKEKARLEEIVAKRTESLNLALRDVEESKNEMGRQLHMLSRLLASMTHDIQSPLNYIMITSGSIPAMIDKGELGVVSEIGQVISNSSRRMSDLLRGLLDYIKVHVYGNSIQFENVALRQLVDNKYELFKTASEQKGNVFENEVPADLTVPSDAQMLAIMVHNLLDNAVKFTHNGTISVTATGDAGSGVIMYISNSGAGIPLHVIDIINTPDREEADGEMRPLGRKTGLGLLIVKEVAVLIDVKLHVSSEASQTCFTLQFNAARTV